MSDTKTRKKELTVEEFLDAVADPKRRDECRVLFDLMSDVTGETPRLWQGSIVGFGSYHYPGARGRESEWYLTGFSPRKANLMVAIMPSVNSYPRLVEQLGKHTSGVSCLYLKKLEDVDLKVLGQLIKESVSRMKKQPPGT